MNKKILTAAIGAAMVAGPLAAHADIKVSGRVAADLVSLPSGGISGSGITFADWGQSRLQFDGSSDSGLFARAALDTRALFFGVTSPYMTSRDIYMGYKGDWGAISVGRMGTAGKNVEGDPFIATFLELRNNAIAGGPFGSSSFTDNNIQYANKFGDWSLKVQYDIIDDSTFAGFASNYEGRNSNGAIAAGVKGKAGPVGIWAAYNNIGNYGGSYSKIGGNMKFGQFKVNLGYQAGDDLVGHSNFILGGEMDLGSGQMIDVTYADKGRDGTHAYYRIAYMKKMGKSGDFHLGYVNNGARNGGAYINPGNQGIFGVGATVKF
jgi:hypothetical protein